MCAKTTIGVLAAPARSAFEPGELLVAERRHRAGLEVSKLLQADEVHAGLVEAVPALAVAVVIEVLQIAGRRRRRSCRARRARCALGRRGSPQQLARSAEFLGLREMADVAGVDDERGRFGQRVDVGDRAAQAADDVGVGVLAKADVRVADLHEGQVAPACDAAIGVSSRVAPSALGDATAHRPHDGGRAPCGKALQRFSSTRVSGHSSHDAPLQRVRAIPPRSA